MKRLFQQFVAALAGTVLLLSMAVSALPAVAQSPAPARHPADSVRYEAYDSLVYVLVSRVDTSLVGTDVFKMLQEDTAGRAPVRIHQSKKVENAMASIVQSNKERTFEGYRVRIFFKESARAESEEIQKSFEARHPGIPAYRSYANPYFKVTVGDFRTKSEAMQLMSSIISEYPTAFVVKEPIRYPVVNKENTYYIDTVKVYRPIVRE